MIFAVIPGYNEEKTIGDIIRRAKNYVDVVVYVDDGSEDRSAEVARRNGAKVIRFKRNMGKGWALRTGFSFVLRNGADVVVVLDSDGQHNPDEIPRFIKALKGYDMVIGSRYAGRFYTFPRNVIGNFGLNFITNFFSYGPQGLLRHQWLGDTQSGFRAFRADALRKMNLTGKRYEIEGEMIYEAAVNNLKVKEISLRVPIRVKGVTIKDGVRNAIFMFKKRFRL